MASAPSTRDWTPPTAAPAAAPVTAGSSLDEIDELWRTHQLSRLREALDQAGHRTDIPEPEAADSDRLIQADYAARVVAVVRPQIVYFGASDHAVAAEVELRLDVTSGRILRRQLRKSSGVQEWDRAVLAALDKTGQLPMPQYGPAPGSLLLVFTPAKR